MSFGLPTPSCVPFSSLIEPKLSLSNSAPKMILHGNLLPLRKWKKQKPKTDALKALETNRAKARGSFPKRFRRGTKKGFEADAVKALEAEQSKDAEVDALKTRERRIGRSLDKNLVALHHCISARTLKS